MKTTLFIIAGLPGSGKTTIGKEISKILKATFIDKDTISNQFTELILKISGFSPNDRESPFYLNEVRDIEYQTMLDIAFENIKCGNSVVCSAPFIKELKSDDWIIEIKRKADMLNTSVSIVWIDADVEKTKDRIISRKSDRDDWKLKNWPEYSNANAKLLLEISTLIDKIYINNNIEDTEPKSIGGLISILTK